MATSVAPLPLAPDIRALLAGLRWRIRAYVWLEGFFLALVWLGITFWAALALDYLPVLVGASEMPWQARAVILAAIAGVLGFILYRWILRRAFVRLADHSMAVVLERRFARFQDSLVTAVEMNERPDHAIEFNRDMLSHTKDDALAQIGHVRLSEVFNFAPLLLSGLLAILLGGTVALFGVINLEALTLWTSRLYLLNSDPWPRSARITEVGLEVLRASSVAGESPTSQLVWFDDAKALKVAKGSNVKLRVHADAAARVVPEVCSLRYRTADGDRGRVNMQKNGQAKKGNQDYSFDGKPLKGILSTIDFDVIGYDHRVAGYRIDVVESPAVVETQLHCVFPPYMVDEKNSLRLPRTLDLTTGMQLPRGTSITIEGRANKDLREVRIRNVDSTETTTINITGKEADPQRFSFQPPRLDQNLALEVTLLDADGVLSERPHRVVVTAVADEAPRVEALLEGIGSAITPDARIPVAGKVVDDYDVAKTWFELSQGDLDPHEHPIELAAAGKLSAAVDLREIRGDDDKGFALKPKDKLSLTVKSSDKYDLEGAANIGSGDRYELDVVTPEELLALLETREAGMRRRFEQIIEEMIESRDSLVRVKSESAGAPEKTPVVVPGETPLDPAEAARRAKSLKLLFVQRALLQSQKSAQEVLGVSGAFRDIREEIINNRIDSEDRKARLKDEVADPLEHVAKELFPELDRRLTQLESVLSDPKTADPAAQAAIDQANDILLELDKVLQKLIKFETYNELIDIVRSLITEQERLIDATKTQQKNEAKRDLLK